LKFSPEGKPHKEKLTIIMSSSSSTEKRVVKIGLVQDAWTEDAAAHKQSIREKVLQAAQQGVQLVLLQELTLHRYFGDKEKTDSEVFDLAEELYTGPTSVFCNELAKEANLWIVGSIF
jgi:N-carbamoylputrescine amidase